MKSPNWILEVATLDNYLAYKYMPKNSLDVEMDIIPTFLFVDGENGEIQNFIIL
ncbi:unnamed protein product [marine sediment metagenome]|uniref:Uncharacterized protein n=1 Tax=marine sediment metagenome TaxID=412755 RepID=X1BYZ2_9ZZZZ